MNERIKKLAEQAGFQYIKDEGIGWAGNYNDSLPKFAELLVRECIEIVEPCKCGCCDGEPEGIIADTIIKQIKKHFGVE